MFKVKRLFLGKGKKRGLEKNFVKRIPCEQNVLK